MKKHFRKIIVFLALILLTGCGTSFQITMPDASLMKVGSESIGHGEAMLLLMNLKCHYEEQYIDSYGTDFWENEMEYEYSFQEFLLDNDYRNELCALLYMQNMAEEEKITLTDAEKEQIEAMAEEYYANLTAAEREFSGAKISDVERLYEKYRLAEKWITSITDDISREVSEEEARVMQMKRIYVTDAATAEEVWNQAVLGANFDSLAAIYNKSEEYICYVSRNDYGKTISRQLFSMKDGAVSDILEEHGGYYIFLCVNSYEKERTQENKEKVYRENVYQRWHDLYKENIKQEKISINNRLWNRIDLSYNENVSNHSLFELYEKYMMDE